MVAASAVTIQESPDAPALRSTSPAGSPRTDTQAPLCHFCGRPSGHFTRHDFLRPPLRAFRRRHLARDAPS